MSKFKVGDRVVCINAAGLLGLLDINRVYTVKTVNLECYRMDMPHAAIELHQIQGYWGIDRFQIARPGVFTARSEYIPMVDEPNNDMIDRDDNKKKRKEFDAIIRQREYNKRREELRQGVEPPEPPITIWDAEDLSNAIEKTCSNVTHPQAMWRH